MHEKIYNLFVYENNDIIDEIGYVQHLLPQQDDNFYSHYLQSRVEEDCKISRRAKLNEELNFEKYFNLCRIHKHLMLFEDFFVKTNAPQDPFTLVTLIKDGQPVIDQTVSHNFKSEDLIIKNGRMKDYLEEYMQNSGFDIFRLLNDDYIVATKILFNNGHYVSFLKLFLIFIDTISYLEFGYESDSFKNWLNKYVKMEKIGITTEELWEFRNSLLHMTNTQSRKVKNNKVIELSPYFKNNEINYPMPKDTKLKHFDAILLRDVILKEGLVAWVQTYNANPSKWEVFIERYDQIISDVRYLKVNV